MKSKRLSIGIIGIIILLVLFIFVVPKIENSIYRRNVPLSSPSVSPSQPLPDVFDIVIANNRISAGPLIFSVNQGDTVLFNIVSDTDNTFVIEGYQKSIALKKNQNVALQFIADKSGEFPLEVKETSVKIGTLTINPK